MSLKDQLHVMVVDDMATSRGLILQSLEWMGIGKVDHCGDAETAFRRLAANPAHLVISDYHMPGGDGLVLLEGLRKFPATRSIGFILVTGSADAATIERGKSLGLNNYLRKPFSNIQFRSCIERVVGKL